MGWLLDQASRPPIATESTRPRTQIALDGMTYEDVLSTRAKATLGLGVLEFSAQGTRLSGFPNLFGQSTASSELLGIGSLFGIEVGRFFASEDGVYGRLSLEFLSLEPESNLFWKIQAATGILPTLAVPWSMELELTGIFSQARVQQFIQARFGGSYFWLPSGISLGWHAHVSYRLRSTTEEYLWFQMVPEVALDSMFGQWALAVPVRVRVNRAPNMDLEPAFSGPAIHLRWTYRL